MPTPDGRDAADVLQRGIGRRLLVSQVVDRTGGGRLEAVRRR
jgi:hypothetical protein